MNYLKKSGISAEHKAYKSIKYIKTVPDSLQQETKYPVLLFLHSAGSRGDDISKVETNPFFEAMGSRDDVPFIIIAPQCGADTWFDIFQELKELVLAEANDPLADASRIYAIGASMGGYGVWQIAMSMPEIFAAIVPICGGGMYWNAPRLKNIGVWAFHGRDDSCVLCRESEKMVDAVNACGGEAKLTVYENCFHDSWNGAYAEPDLFNWMLAHKNKGYTETSRLSGHCFG